MPTGYTAKLHNGEEQTFPEFVMSCARAFGALITMRDDPADAEIPDEFKPSDYHVRELEKARERLSEVEGWTFDQVSSGGQRRNTAGRRIPHVRTRRFTGFRCSRTSRRRTKATMIFCGGW